MILWAEPTGGDFKLLEAGTYPARCVKVVYIGTQQVPVYQWTGTQPKKQIMFGFEFPTETEVFNEENGEQPYFLWTFPINFVAGEKAKLNILLNNWLGKKIDPKEFDVASVLGQTAAVTVYHSTSASGWTYANIKLDSITPVMKGVTVPEASNPLVDFSVDEFDQNTYDALPEFIRNKIDLSEERENELALNDPITTKDGVEVPF